jgi:hypothetical protein
MLDVSERRVCWVLGQHRSTQRKVPCGADDEEALTDDIVALARQYGRYGYRRVSALLHAAGWLANHKRMERIWRREGLKVPRRQQKRGRLWLNDGSCIRLRPDPSAEPGPQFGAGLESVQIDTFVLQPQRQPRTNPRAPPVEKAASRSPGSLPRTCHWRCI